MIDKSVQCPSMVSLKTGLWKQRCDLLRRIQWNRQGAEDIWARS